MSRSQREDCKWRRIRIQARLTDVQESGSRQSDDHSVSNVEFGYSSSSNQGELFAMTVSLLFLC